MCVVVVGGVTGLVYEWGIPGTGSHRTTTPPVPTLPTLCMLCTLPMLRMLPAPQLLAEDSISLDHLDEASQRQIALVGQQQKVGTFILGSGGMAHPCKALSQGRGMPLCKNGAVSGPLGPEAHTPWGRGF